MNKKDQEWIAYCQKIRAEERNKTIELCIVHLGNKFPEYGPKEFSIREIRKELEALKHPPSNPEQS